MSDLRALIERVEGLTKRDRWLDHRIAEALGGRIRRVGRLGLNGRTPGSDRVFWPHKTDDRKGSAIPYYTKDEKSRSRVLATLRAIEAATGGRDD